MHRFDSALYREIYFFCERVKLCKTYAYAYDFVVRAIH